MSSTVLEVILKIVALVYADVSPELKAAALAELQKIAATETGHPLLSFAITAAEAVVNAVPMTLDPAPAVKA